MLTPSSSVVMQRGRCGEDGTLTFTPCARGSVRQGTSVSVAGGRADWHDGHVNEVEENDVPAFSHDVIRRHDIYVEYEGIRPKGNLYISCWFFARCERHRQR